MSKPGQARLDDWLDSRELSPTFAMGRLRSKTARQLSFPGYRSNSIEHCLLRSRIVLRRSMC
jgi:hypothetical protein